MPEDENMVPTEFPVKSLTELANDFGSDKGAEHTRLIPKMYTRIYDAVLQGIRGEKVGVIEIGVYEGSSLKMWEAYFHNSKVVGIDINPDCKKYETDRTSIVIGDQCNEAVMQQAIDCLDSPPKLIVDDGSHKSRDHILSFKYLFPRLESGGYYFVEDLHTCYMRRYVGFLQRSSMSYFKGIADDLASGGISRPARRGSPFLNDIDSIHFWRSLVLIKKK